MNMVDERKKTYKISTLILDSLILLVKCIVSLMICLILCAMMDKSMGNGFFVLLFGASLSYAIHEWLSEVRFLKRWSFFGLLFYVMMFFLLIGLQDRSLCGYNLAYTWDFIAKGFSDNPFVDIAVPLLIVISALLRSRRGKLRWQEWISFPTTFLLFLSGGNVFLVSILSLSLIGYTTYDGYRRDDPFQMNVGLGAYIIWIAIALMDFDPWKFHVEAFSGLYKYGVISTIQEVFAVLVLINYIRMSIQRKRASLLKEQPEVDPPTA